MIIGWIGTGMMGASMAGHLLRGGHAVVVHSRARAKAEALLAAASWSLANLYPRPISRVASCVGFRAESVKKETPASVSVGNGERDMRSNIGVLAAWSVAVFGLRAFSMGADHPAHQPVNLSESPAGLNALVNSTNRVHGYFVNAEDRFFFAGDTESFSAFLKQYAALDGIAGHRLTVREGEGQARSPWD